jgi:hypothetical protein
MKRFYIAILFLLLGVIPAYAQTNDGWWRMEFPDDNFAEAALDLRFLNEEIAGQNGFIKLSADGKSFVTENGKPVRFWAINGASISEELTDAQLAYYARFLAKMGVNIIRFHGNISPKAGATSLSEVNMDEVRAIWRTVAAMKKEGIYTVISPFWGGYMDPIPASWGLGEYTGEGHMWALMYFSEPVKTAYKEWVRVLYTQINPLTGIALKDEPAVALIQIKNEDSVLFWTIGGIKPNHKATIEQAFHAWLVKKYGTIQGAYTAWSNETLPEDNVAGGYMGLFGIWEATLDAKKNHNAGKAARVSDQVEFLSSHQQNFYTEIYNHYKTLGCKQLINANNWRPADPGVLFDAERWSNSSVDVMAVNRYYDPGHQGENSSWRIDPGHTYIGESVLKNPTQFPINIKQVDNKPFLVTESGWNLPHKYQAEGPFLIAAYMSLTGIDGFFWFAASSHKIDPDPYYPWFNIGPKGDQKAMSRWTASVPGQLSMFPANALLYRKGYITQGATVVHEERTLASLWKRDIPLITEEAGFDPNRDSWNNTPGSTETEVAPIAYLAGPVEVKYGGNPQNNNVSGALGSLLDFPNKTVTSTTGQLKWNYNKGICTMNAPKAQGVAGFLEAGAPTVQLADVTITSTNPYAAINVVSMDDLPLSQSQQILVQVGTVYRPTGWQEKPVKVTINDQQKDGFEIINTGRMPWQGENTKVKLKLNNTLIKSAYVLDQSGYISKEIFVERHPDHIILMLPPNTMYMILNTNEPTVITGIDDENLAAIKLYPNPAKGTVMLEIPDHAKSVNLLQVYDNLGRLVYTERNIKPGQKQITMPKLPNGLYHVTFNSAQHKNTSIKLIIQD